jgi:hypothetical protein
MMTATGWRAYPVRGAMDGAIRRELGLAVVSEMVHGERRYRIPAEPS